MWIELLKKEIKIKGASRVACELGVSKSTISLVCNGKYPAGMGKIEERIRKIYSNNGMIECPVLGPVSPADCAENWQRAKAIGNRASNPQTIKLYHQCRRCGIRQ